jgi:peptidoglycan/xylan/chitin deacetylase (PgdA/CDA1 family)
MNHKPKGKAVILIYHQVGKNPTEQTNLDCYCDQERFEEQMSYLDDSHFKVISLESLVAKINAHGTCLEEDYVVLTFDDGCDKFSKSTLPTLSNYNFPSTIYPVAGCLGHVASWPKPTNPDLQIVSEFALKELSDQGVNIGAHTMTHVKLSACDIDLAKEEIANSKKNLEYIIGKEVASFSYPHGDYNEDVCALINSLGFSNAVTCTSGFVGPGTKLFQLPRKYVTYFDTLEKFKNILFHE